MGSRSDWETMQHAAQKLEALGVPFEVKVVSAHRTPDVLFSYAEQAGSRGLRAIIAGAGGAAHLPGMIAAKTASNAALFAAAMLASDQPAIGQALDSFRARQTEDVMAHDDPRQ